jgi:hypothetical protein
LHLLEIHAAASDPALPPSAPSLLMMGTIKSNYLF